MYQFAFPTNPAAISLYDLLKAGHAFENPVSSASTSALSQLENTHSILVSERQYYVDPLGGTTVSNPELEGLISAVERNQGAVTSFLGHTNGLIGDLPNILASARQLNAIAATVQASSFDPDNPCASVLGFIGSILDAGPALLNAVIGVIDGLVSAIARAVGAGIRILVELGSDAVEALIGALDSATERLQKMISDELEKLESVGRELLDWAKANLTFGLAMDPCVRQVLHKVGTEAYRTVVSQLPVPSVPGVSLG